MKFTLTWARTVPVLFAIAMTTVGTGCSEESVFCQSFCDCVRCDDSGLQECRAQLDSTRSYAETAGCGDEYSAYLDCQTNEGTCVDQDWEAAPCEAADTAFAECLGAGE